MDNIPIHPNLVALKDLTEKLISETGKPSVRYKTKSGQCFGYYLFNNDKVAVQRVEFSDDCVLQHHIHPNSVEWLIVYTGSMEVEMDGETKIYGIGESVVFPPQKNHSVKALENLNLIAISVPADEGFPHE